MFKIFVVHLLRRFFLKLSEESHKNPYLLVYFSTLYIRNKSKIRNLHQLNRIYDKLINFIENSIYISFKRIRKIPLQLVKIQKTFNINH